MRLLVGVSLAVVCLAQAQTGNLTLKIPPVRTSLNLEGHPVEITVWGAVSAAPSGADAGLAGADDAAQLESAASSRGVLVTHGTDFLRLHAGGAAPIGELLRFLVLIHDLLSPEEMAGRVELL